MRRVRTAWSVLAGVAALIGGLLAVIPTYTTETCGTDGCHSSTETLIEVNGVSVLIPLLVPALICLIPAMAAQKWVSWAIAISFLALCLITGFSIGMFFLPVAVGGIVLALGHDSVAGRARASR